FNPDHDEAPPAVVLGWRRELATADAVLVSSPEYAHGIVGAFKNALDWVVGSGELSAKPIGIINASPSLASGDHAHNALVEILTVMDANVVHDAIVRVPAARTKVDADGR